MFDFLASVKITPRTGATAVVASPGDRVRIVAQPVVRRVEIASRRRHPAADPGVAGVGTYRSRSAGRRAGGEIAADVAPAETETAQPATMCA